MSIKETHLLSAIWTIEMVSAMEIYVGSENQRTEEQKHSGRSAWRRGDSSWASGKDNWIQRRSNQKQKQQNDSTGQEDLNEKNCRGENGHGKCPPLSIGDTFQDSQWMPETMDSTELCIYSFFLYIRTYEKV